MKKINLLFLAAITIFGFSFEKNEFENYLNNEYNFRESVDFSNFKLSGPSKIYSDENNNSELDQAWYQYTISNLQKEDNAISNSELTPQPWSTIGEHSSDRYGFCVSPAGDVNGDGFKDVIIGAYGNNNNTGKAYVFYGNSNGLATSPAWTATGESSNHLFGFSLCGAGDVNEDGFSDVIVGASGYNNFTGKVYLYLGSSSGLSNTASWVKTGDTFNSYFGRVASAGDVNNDGFDDVIIGAIGSNNFAGKATVYLGSTIGLSNTPVWSYIGEFSGNYFGHCVSSAGDVNGDNYNDVIISTDDYNGNISKAYIFHGNPTGLNATPNWISSDGISDSYYGYSSASAGDVNNDGYDDVVVGALGVNGSTGKAYVYYGSSTGVSLLPNWTASGESFGSEFGYCVASAGDINGDNISDLVIGADGYNSEVGRVYFYFGSNTGLSSGPNGVRTGEGFSRFGKSVAGAGDINNDGFDDIIVGAYKFNLLTGKAYAYFGNSCGIISNVWTQAGENIENHYGYCVASAGDINDDGFNDVIIGAYGFNNNTGKAYVYYGSSCGLPVDPDWTATGEFFNNNFGESLSGAGDVNNDGFSDVIVGANGYNNFTGKIYLYLGSSTGLSNTASWVKTGENLNSYFGTVSSAGDVNNDGFDDVIIGAIGSNNFAGKATVYLGSSTGLSNTPVWSYNGESSGNYLGHCVSSAGDVNGDNYSDVIISTDDYNGNLSKAYIFHGNSTGLNPTPNWIASDGISNSYYGYSSASAGDVNNDGYDDVVVGALGVNGSSGRAYVYYGSSTGVSLSPNWTASGEAVGSEFGYCVASAGDINGDSISDLIISADGYNFQIGRVYLYYGSNNGLGSTPDWIKTGEEYGRFGKGVAGAGDVNGDNKNELLVGAHRFDDKTGKAYLFNFDKIVGINDPSVQVPVNFTLYQNFPNPFNPSTDIRFTITKNDYVKLSVFNSLGQLIHILVNGYLTAGNYKYKFDANRLGLALSSGAYFYRLETGKHSETKKMLLLK